MNNPSQCIILLAAVTFFKWGTPVEITSNGVASLNGITLGAGVHTITSKITENSTYKYEMTSKDIKFGNVTSTQNWEVGEDDLFKVYDTLVEIIDEEFESIEGMKSNNTQYEIGDTNHEEKVAYRQLNGYLNEIQYVLQLLRNNTNRKKKDAQRSIIYHLNESEDKNCV